MTWACSGSPKGWPPTLLRHVAHQGWLNERRWLQRDGYADSEPEVERTSCRDLRVESEELGERSRRRVRDLVTRPAFEGLSEIETGRARISMMARSNTLHQWAGYSRARPVSAAHKIWLATHGRSIQSGQERLSSTLKSQIIFGLLDLRDRKQAERCPKGPYKNPRRCHVQNPRKSRAPTGRFLPYSQLMILYDAKTVVCWLINGEHHHGKGSKACGALRSR